jgi:hypothetical protein
VIITATLVFFPDWTNVVAIGFLEGLAPKPLVLISVAPTVWEAFQGMFAQAQAISLAVTPRWPLTTIARN